jgi:hypothetical protein
VPIARESKMRHFPTLPFSASVKRSWSDILIKLSIWAVAVSENVMNEVIKMYFIESPYKYHFNKPRRISEKIIEYQVVKVFIQVFFDILSWQVSVSPNEMMGL